MNWFRLMLFALMVLFVSHAIYTTISISCMTDDEFEPYVKEELYPQKKRISRSYNFIEGALYNWFGKCGIYLYYWGIAIIAFIMWMLSRKSKSQSIDKQEAQKIKAQEEAELAKRRKRFNKRQRGKH